MKGSQRKYSLLLFSSILESVIVLFMILVVHHEKQVTLNYIPPLCFLESCHLINKSIAPNERQARTNITMDGFSLSHRATKNINQVCLIRYLKGNDMLLRTLGMGTINGVEEYFRNIRKFVWQPMYIMHFLILYNNFLFYFIVTVKSWIWLLRKTKNWLSSVPRVHAFHM